MGTKIDNKGFTLVELIAVMVILVSIALVAVGGITSSLEKREIKECKEQQELAISAAKIYFSLNEATSVTLNVLNGSSGGVDYFKNDNKIDKLKDGDVIMFKNGKYIYTSSEGSCKIVTSGNNEDIPVVDEVVTITFDPNGGDMSTLYTDSGEHTYTVPKTGTYKLEVWGAQGGGNGGYGSYSSGNLSLNAGTVLYVNIGGQGKLNNGGSNGGGDGQVIAGTVSPAGYGGGGATHIASASGMLKNVNSSKIYIVAGGGGGGSEAEVQGAHAGGYKGNDSTGGCFVATGGTQSSGGSPGDEDATAGGYGYGGSAPYGDESNAYGAGGGGGGYYGGGGNSYYYNNPDCSSAGAGGSGYIGNSLLTNKAMYCYNCETSNEETIKTYTTTNVSEIPTANYAKMGDGAVRITWLGTNDKIVTGGSTYGELPTPSRYKYKFVGWNTKADGSGTTITSSSTVDLLGNTTLYAMWKIKSNNTVYLYNNGTWNTNFTGEFRTKAQPLEAGANIIGKVPDISEGSSSFRISVDNDDWGTEGVGGTAYWATAIDLTNYNMLIFEGSFSNVSSFWRGVGIWRDMSGYVWTNMAGSIKDLGNGVGVVDISDLEGKYYIGFWVYYTGTSLTCKSLRLE